MTVADKSCIESRTEDLLLLPLVSSMRRQKEYRGNVAKGRIREHFELGFFVSYLLSLCFLLSSVFQWCLVLLLLKANFS